MRIANCEIGGVRKGSYRFPSPNLKFEIRNSQFDIPFISFVDSARIALVA